MELEYEDTFTEETLQLLPSPTQQPSSSIRAWKIPLATAFLTVIGISLWLLGQRLWSVPPVRIQNTEEEVLFRDSCVADWMNCTMAGCCASKGHSCYKSDTNWATCELHRVELSRGKNENHVSCTWTGSNCTDTKCCNDDSSRCYQYNETYAVCESKKTILLPEDVRYKGAKEYEIIYPNKLNVRAKKDLNSGILGHKVKGNIILGQPDGKWVKLVGEPGYMVTVVYGKSTMKLRKNAEGNETKKAEDKNETKKVENEKETEKPENKEKTTKVGESKEATAAEDKKEGQKVEDKKRRTADEDKKKTKKVEDETEIKKREDEEEIKKAVDEEKRKIAEEKRKIEEDNKKEEAEEWL